MKSALVIGRRHDRADLGAHSAFGRLRVPRKLAADELGVAGPMLIDRANDVERFAVSRPAHHDMELTGASLRNLSRGLKLAARQA